MQTMNIPLPDPLKAFVHHQIAEGRDSTVSEYIRELIRDDEKRKAEERLEMLGLDSEESELTKQDFEDIRKEALAQLKRREKKDWRCRRSISGPVLARPDRARVPRRAWRR
jgi:antitoxin ParD1/3/4